MNADDTLQRAMNALRAVTEAEPTSASQVEATQRRILASIAQRKRTSPYRPMAMAAGAVMALALGSSAWAAATGHWPWQRTSPSPVPQTVINPPTPSTTPPSVIEPSVRVSPSQRSHGMLPARVQSPVVILPSPPAKSDRVERALPTVSTVGTRVSEITSHTIVVRTAVRSLPGNTNPSLLVSVHTTASETERPTPVVAATVTTPVVVATVTTPVVVATVTTPTAQQVTTDALYRRGHAAQFVTHDMTEALDAWNDYLREDPDGRYAPEARFNRAIALARLGQRAQAVSALHAIADSSYRRADVLRLLEALEQEVTDSNESAHTP